VPESVFSWPGIGRLTLSAISNRDYAFVQGCILAVGLTYAAYTIANPRIRTKKQTWDGSKPSNLVSWSWL